MTVLQIIALCLIAAVVSSLVDYRIAKNKTLPFDPRTWSDE